MKIGKLLFLFVVFAMPAIQSCQKEETLTSAEQKGLELKKVVADKSITSTSVFKYDYYNASWDYEIGGSFEINGAFIKVGNYYFSLDNLFKYSCLETDNGWVLLLYFQ